MHLFSTNIQSMFGPCYNWNYPSYSSLHYLFIQFMPGKEPKSRFSVHFEYFGTFFKRITELALNIKHLKNLVVNVPSITVDVDAKLNFVKR